MYGFRVIVALLGVLLSVATANAEHPAVRTGVNSFLKANQALRRGSGMLDGSYTGPVDGRIIKHTRGKLTLNVRFAEHDMHGNRVEAEPNMFEEVHAPQELEEKTVVVTGNSLKELVKHVRAAKAARGPKITLD